MQSLPAVRRISAKMSCSTPATGKKFCVDIREAVFRIVFESCSNYGFELSDVFHDDCFLSWKRHGVDLSFYKSLKQHQKVNRFPNIGVLSHKNMLATLVNKVQNQYPDTFSIIPLSWNLPDDLEKLLEFSRNHKDHTFIRKPHHGSCGTGIYLLNDWKELTMEERKNSVIQSYLDNPLLINGKKFDLRLYALISSCDPMKLYLHENGMLRFASSLYEHPNKANFENHLVHLTNTSISNMNKKATPSQQSPIKSVLWFKDWLLQNKKDAEAIFRKIEDVLIKTVLVVQPYLKHAYAKSTPNSPPNNGSYCFNMLGFDILLDNNGIPYLIEVNSCPKLSGDLIEMKKEILKDVLSVINIQPSDRYQREPDEKPRFGGFKQIHPSGNEASQLHYDELAECCSLVSQNHLEEVETYFNGHTPKNRYYVKGKPNKGENETYDMKVATFYEHLKEAEVYVMSEEALDTKVLEICKREWPIQELQDFWMKNLTFKQRAEILNARRKTIILSLLRVFKVYEEDELVDKRIYSLVQKLLDFLISNEGEGLVEPCLVSRVVNVEVFVLAEEEKLNEMELNCCTRILELYQSIVLTNFALTKPTKSVSFKAR